MRSVLQSHLLIQLITSARKYGFSLWFREPIISPSPCRWVICAILKYQLIRRRLWVQTRTLLTGQTRVIALFYILSCNKKIALIQYRLAIFTIMENSYLFIYLHILCIYINYYMYNSFYRKIYTKSFTLWYSATFLAYVERRIVDKRMKTVSFGVSHLAPRHSSNEWMVSIDSFHAIVLKAFFWAL